MGRAAFVAGPPASPVGGRGLLAAGGALAGEVARQLGTRPLLVLSLEALRVEGAGALRATLLAGGLGLGARARLVLGGLLTVCLDAGAKQVAGSLGAGVAVVALVHAIVEEASGPLSAPLVAAGLVVGAVVGDAGSDGVPGPLPAGPRVAAGVDATRVQGASAGTAAVLAAVGLRAVGAVLGDAAAQPVLGALAAGLGVLFAVGLHTLAEGDAGPVLAAVFAGRLFRGVIGAMVLHAGLGHGCSALATAGGVTAARHADACGERASCTASALTTRGVDLRAALRTLRRGPVAENTAAGRVTAALDAGHGDAPSKLTAALSALALAQILVERRIVGAQCGFAGLDRSVAVVVDAGEQAECAATKAGNEKVSHEDSPGLGSGVRPVWRPSDTWPSADGKTGDTFFSGRAAMVRSAVRYPRSQAVADEGLLCLQSLT